MKISIFFLIDVVLYPNLMKIHLFSYFDIFTIYSKYKFSRNDGDLYTNLIKISIFQM